MSLGSFRAFVPPSPPLKAACGLSVDERGTHFCGVLMALKEGNAKSLGGEGVVLPP